MTIYLISQETYEELLQIQKQYPVFTYNFQGYGGLDRSKFSEEEKTADASINEILKTHIKDFREFQNFCTSKSGELCLRFQYRWTPNVSFTGVGYLKLTELLNGFENKD